MVGEEKYSLYWSLVPGESTRMRRTGGLQCKEVLVDHRLGDLATRQQQHIMDSFIKNIRFSSIT